MCTDAAEGIKLQCGREYGFSDSEPPQSTQLDKLTVNEPTGLPSNNLDTEHDFSEFSLLSEVAGGQKFSAKGIQSDMTLFKSKKKRSAKYNQKSCKCFKHERKIVE